MESPLYRLRIKLNDVSSMVHYVKADNLQQIASFVEERLASVSKTLDDLRGVDLLRMDFGGANPDLYGMVDLRAPLAAAVA